MSETLRIYDKSQWNIFRIDGKTLGKDPKYPRSLTHWTVSINKSLELLPSHYVLPENSVNRNKMEYFLIDEEDMLAAEHASTRIPEFAWESSLKHFGTLGDFTNTLKTYADTQKKMYLRVITSNILGDEPAMDSRVFVDEVVIMIPLLREQQGMPFENAADEKNAIFNRFNPVPSLFSTMTLSELESLLVEYDVDKSLLTLVDDPVHIIGWKSQAITGSPFKILNAAGVPIISREEAVLYLFEHLVCKSKWGEVSLEQRESVIEVIFGFTSQQTGDYLDYKTILALCVKKKQTIFGSREVPSTFQCLLMHDKSPNDCMNQKHYEELSTFCNVPYYTFANMTVPLLQIWLLRLFLILGWLHSITKNDEKFHPFLSDIADTIIIALMPTVPKSRRQFIEDVKDEAVAHMRSPPVAEGNPLLIYAQPQQSDIAEMGT